MNDICVTLTGNSRKQCLTDSKKITSFVNQNKTICIDNLDSDKNQLLNMDSLHKLVDEAWATIRIYTDSIKDDTHGDKIFIDKLTSWIIQYPHTRLKILLKSNQEDIAQTKLYKALDGLDKEYKKQVEIRYIKKPLETDFNCLIVDQSSYKLRLVNDNKAYLSFNDVQGVAKSMSVVFNKHFSKKRSNGIMEPNFNLGTVVNQFFNKIDNKKLAESDPLSALINNSIPKSFSGFAGKALNIRPDWSVI